MADNIKHKAILRRTKIILNLIIISITVTLEGRANCAGAGRLMSLGNYATEFDGLIVRAGAHLRRRLTG